MPGVFKNKRERVVLVMELIITLAVVMIILKMGARPHTRTLADETAKKAGRDAGADISSYIASVAGTDEKAGNAMRQHQKELNSALANFTR